MEAHDKFLELCALSTSGELTEDEQKLLGAHLAKCPSCWDSLKQFEAAASIGVPLLHSQLLRPDSSESGRAPAELSTATSVDSTAHMEPARKEREALERSSGLGLPGRNGHSPMHVNWDYVWMPFAAAVVLTAALGIYSYQFGKHKGQEVVQNTPSISNTNLDALEQQISDFGHEREALKTQLAQRDGMVAELRRQMAAQSAVMAEVKNVQASLEQSQENNQIEKQQAAQERSGLIQKLDAAQVSLQKTQAELDSLLQQRSQDQSRTESLEAQIRDLHGQLRDREQELSKAEELLAHDRDVRELMGARDLYIAEVYDVARDGQTQKPYGRVFYTKGKSLIFYAYDLDQQAGFKTASTFQAWGSHGPDKQQATSLGVFYEDNLAKKRWVLKFDDPKKLQQIDTVFVTVEPNGGSHKPSGKPLLFAYLKVEPNHP
jgi:hypothetical protein